jgi:hypothetical protein
LIIEGLVLPATGNPHYFINLPEVPSIGNANALKTHIHRVQNSIRRKNLHLLSCASMFVVILNSDLVEIEIVC